MDEQLDNAPCLFFSFTDDGIIKEINNTLLARTGYKKEQLAGNTVELLLPIASKIFYHTHLFPLLKLQGEVEEIFISLRTSSDQELPLLMNAKRNNTNGIAVNECMGIIVTNRKKFEDELIRSKKETEAALKENTALLQMKKELDHHSQELEATLRTLKLQNEELTQFNKVVTHDLQEPVRKISFFGQLIEQEGLLSSEQGSNALTRLTAVCAQMRSVLSALQQYVWLSDVTLDIEQVDLGRIVRNVEKKIRLSENEQFELTCEQLPTIDGDKDMLAHLFFNILENAIKYRKPQMTSRIIIHAIVVHENKYQHRENKYEYVPYVRISVSDNGAGFAQEYSGQIFGLFQKLHNEPGMGLGLAMCKKIVDHHHGFITADSHPGDGTTITIMLPLTQEQSHTN